MYLSGSYYYGSDHTFIANNAKSAYDGTRYIVNLYVGAVNDFTNSVFTTWQNYLASFAKYLFDATDAKIRLGTIVICDNVKSYTNADIQIKPGYGSDGGSVGGIETSSFISLGELGTVYIESWSSVNPGWIIAHEFGHYGLYLKDEYDNSNHKCIDNNKDTCMMSARYYTELCSNGYHNTFFGADSCWGTLTSSGHYSRLTPPVTSDQGSNDQTTDGGAVFFIQANTGNL
jgi:hypothetical protein